jgi:ATP-dependent Clp protease ATP-binding subunit ClpC
VFEKYSDKSRRVVFFARYEASLLGAEAIEPEHILLSIMKENPGLAESILPKGAAAVAEIRKTIEAEMRHEPKQISSVDLPLSPSSKRVMHIASDETEKAGDQRIEPRHLLLGLRLDEGSRANGLLRLHGATADLILQKSLELPATPPPKNESEASRILAQLSALVEVLIRQGVFSRQDLAEELANRYILPDLHATLNSLLVILVRKGLINDGDRRNIVGFSDR